ncbi:hypothetical protein EVAR_20308_1 [Eumeta japonica]|uniref:Endonuclease/exonuclease/phosphatase domain-containing protein n=1 Tax=Eumeta variegata TaxID=151549 RepID=A0A4C1VQS6_EUMVA|nr:hypothetical protein EVAR_20308_1 [Eumeta japonica]
MPENILPALIPDSPIVPGEDKIPYRGIESTRLDCGDEVRHPLRLVRRRGEKRTGDVVVESSNVDPSILFGVALIRANEDAAVSSSYQKAWPLPDWRSGSDPTCCAGIVGVFPPDMSKSLKEQEEFWADVRDILVKCDRIKRIVTLGDFNG